MMGGYWDAAGHPATKDALTVYGHFSSVTNWNKLERQWKKVLRKHEIQAQPFHMTDFMSCNGKNGIYRKFRDKPDDQAAVLRELVAPIIKYVRACFSETIKLQDWHDVNDSDYELAKNHCTPYALAAWFTMDKMIRYWAHRRYKHQAHFLFEGGDHNRGDFELMMIRVRKKHKELHGLVPAPGPKGFVPFQTVDLAGWTMRTAAIAYWEGKKPSKIPSKVIDELKPIMHRKTNDYYMKKSDIVAFCEKNDMPKKGEKRKWASFPGSFVSD